MENKLYGALYTASLQAARVLGEDINKLSCLHKNWAKKNIKNEIDEAQNLHKAA